MSWGERFWIRLFKSLVRLDAFRQRRLKTYHIVAHIISYVGIYTIAYCLGIDRIKNPEPWPSILPLSAVAKILMFVPASLIAQFIGGGLLPVLSYAPHAIAMKRLGLFSITNTASDYSEMLEHCIANHDSKDKVKVLCITGEHLFRENINGVDSEPPLKRLADEGRLEVVMPRSENGNRTIQMRWNTYDENFRLQHGLATVEEYIQNHVNPTKIFLLGKRNAVFDHNQKSLWRIIIFSKFCMVQFYFPNKPKKESFNAPLIVFQKTSEPSIDSFYETVCKQYEIVREDSSSTIVPRATTAGFLSDSSGSISSF